jgi:hypothetical protein
MASVSKQAIPIAINDDMTNETEIPVEAEMNPNQDAKPTGCEIAYPAKVDTTKIAMASQFTEP